MEYTLILETYAYYIPCVASDLFPNVRSLLLLSGMTPHSHLYKNTVLKHLWLPDDSMHSASVSPKARTHWCDQ